MDHKKTTNKGLASDNHRTLLNSVLLTVN